MSSSTHSILSTTIPLYNTLIDHAKEIINTENIISIKVAAEKCKEKLLEYYNRTNETYLIATILNPRFKTLISSIYNTFYAPTLSEVSNENESFEQKNSIIGCLFKKCCTEKIDELQVYLSLPTVDETVNFLECVSSEQCFSISKNLITDNRNQLAGKTVRASKEVYNNNAEISEEEASDSESVVTVNSFQSEHEEWRKMAKLEKYKAWVKVSVVKGKNLGEKIQNITSALDKNIITIRTEKNRDDRELYIAIYFGKKEDMEKA
ncbi:6580_t:CDS:2, partial [Diversispora eburnea]